MSSGSPKNVVLATIALNRMAGGLERNIIRIANHLAGQGHDVSLLSFDFPEAEAFYKIDPSVKWFKLGRTRPHGKIGFFERLALLRRIRASLKNSNLQPVTLIVFHHGLLARALASTLFLKVRIICSERNALTMYQFIKAQKWNLNFTLMFLVSKILVQFESYRANYPALMRHKIQAIPNSVEQVSGQASPAQAGENNRYKMLAVGRLCDQKNYAALITAFGKLADAQPDWDLYIVGDGSFAGQLKLQIQALGLENRVFLTGADSDVASWYLRSHLYVMPSKWEGFPNALAEALAHGLPAVGYAGSAGVRDLIQHGKNGLLAAGNGDMHSLATQMEKLMADPDLRIQMGGAAKESMAVYTPDKIYPQWEKLLNDF